MKIQPARRVHGSVHLPGDKSISHRAALIAALAEGTSRITNFATSEDCRSTLRCLKRLGVFIEHQDQATVRITGIGGNNFTAPAEPLDCGNSGSTMRMLAGVLAGQPLTATLTGDISLRSRPMRRIIEPLELMGARIESAGEGHRAPLHITGGQPLVAITYEMPVASAQVKSCVLLAGLSAPGRTAVIEKNVVTRDHTERMLGWFGISVESTTQMLADDGGVSSHTVAVNGPTCPRGRDYEVPSDISSAAFFLAAAAMLPGSSLEIPGVGLNPTRAQVLHTLKALGAQVQVSNAAERCHELVGDIYVSGTGPLVPTHSSNRIGEQANVLRGPIIAQLIDELPMLAVLGSQVAGGLEIRDAAELRVKESDRIRATVENLRAMGATVEEYADGLAVAGPVRLRGARMNAQGDHRIAMAFAIAALTADGESEIVGAEECVGVSFPGFFALLESLTER